jgi:hypothetical protein
MQHRNEVCAPCLVWWTIGLPWSCIYSAATVKRRRKALGLKGSRAKEKSMPLTECEGLVLQQLDQDPSNRQGVRTIMHKVAHNSGVHLSR